MKRFLARTTLILFLLPATQARLDGHSSNGKNEAATTGPSMVLIIRHAEKPDDATDPNLSKRGFERADALAKVIPNDFVRPDFLFATRKSSHSNRPMETIEPLAKALHLTIDSTFKDDDFAALAHQILSSPRYAGKVVLIAWHHGKIPELAHALGAAAAPEKWNSKEFDRVWEISYENGVATWKNLPQKALPGDSPQ